MLRSACCALACTNGCRSQEQYVSLGAPDCSSSFGKRGWSSNTSQHALKALVKQRTRCCSVSALHLSSCQPVGSDVHLPSCQRHAGSGSRMWCVTMTNQTEVTFKSFLEAHCPQQPEAAQRVPCHTSHTRLRYCSNPLHGKLSQWPDQHLNARGRLLQRTLAFMVLVRCALHTLCQRLSVCV